MPTLFRCLVACAFLISACGDSQTRDSDSGPEGNDGGDGGDGDAAVADAAHCPDDCDDGIACTIDRCDHVSNRCAHDVDIEICDERDNDCDGSADEDLPTTAWYIDRDADRRGDINAEPVLSCGTVEGHSQYNDDCDDNNRAVRPTVSEICNRFDDDCDAMIDENVSVLHFTDQDRDGHGAGPAVAVCAGTAGYAQLSDDCDDDNAQVHPGLLDLCDQLDNDCDATIDEDSVCDPS